MSSKRSAWRAEDGESHAGATDQPDDCWQEQRRVIRIFCEGAKTEPQYFDTVKRLPAVRRSITVKVRSEPRAGRLDDLLTTAIAAKKADQFAEVWCVFDVKARAETPVNHTALIEMRLRAKNESINLAFSNPCFELWLAPHHAKHHAH